MPLVPLGMDVLQFLGACVVVTPVCKKLNVSPILGFLLAGVALRQGNTISDPKELSALAELGVLFLLFEMGLELSSSRLQNLSKYAFGLGTAQVLVTTVVFVLFTLPFGSGLGTLLLERLAGADEAMAKIDTWDEAIVVAVSLSLSSSAFVLQILGEKGQLSTRAGSATLGILLLQDLITVPFLVALPLLAGDNSLEDIVKPALLVQEALPAALKTLLYLGCLVLFGRFGLRRVFEVVAGTKSKDAFVALCILTVCGTAIATENLGFGQTLGAFLAGVLLAETSYRNQVEADLKPFKGLLLGLFFLCTGASVNVDLLVQKFPVVALLTAGLLSVKFAITATASSLFGLSRSESIKVGLTLSQGGEFAFVLLELARQLEVLPGELNNLLIIVVVMSMALTPFLAEWGDAWEQKEQQDAKLSAGESLTYEMVSAPVEEHRKGLVVLCGFNKASQMVTNMISSPLMGKPVPWIAFEFDPKRVRMARAAGLPVFFGDGSRKEVLHPAGVEEPLAFVLTQKSHLQMLESVERIKSDYPDVPVYALCRDMRCAAEIKARGAFVKVSSAQGGLALGDMLLRGIGTPDGDLANLELEMMLAVKEKVRNAALRPHSVDSDLEVFVFDRAQARSFALADEAQRIRNAGKLKAPEQSDTHDPSCAPSRPSHLSRSESCSEHTSDEDESDVEADWRVISPESSADAEILSDTVRRISAGGESKPKASDEADDSVLGGLGVMFKSAQDSVKDWKRSIKRSGSQGNAGSDSYDSGSLDDRDTEWDSEDFAEWKSERENRKAWEKLQLPKVAQTPKTTGSSSDAP